MISNDQIRKQVEHNFEDIRYYRRHIHENPDLSGEEQPTAEFIADLLTKWGIETKLMVSKTGVVGLIKGKNPDKRCVALRADTDALPVQELTGAAFASKKDGIMHACGHDVHTACLLGAAKLLNEMKDDFEGAVKLIFQPSEEKIPGGALPMISEGVMTNPVPDVIFAQHVDHNIPIGKIGLSDGKRSSAVDEVQIKVVGKGGHGAYPHQAVDPILISAHIMTALQQIITRNVDTKEPMVLTFGSIHAGDANNVIPDFCEMNGTLRSTSEFWRDDAHARIESIATGIASAMGGSAEVTLHKGYPAVDNDPALTKRTWNSSKNYLGGDNVIDYPQKMGGEDFAFFQQKTPGVLWVLGVRNEKKDIIYPIHNPKFNVDESSLKLGTGLLIRLTLNELSA